MDNAIIIFARLPRAGKVKTRLAASIGGERAAEFYRQCAEHVIRTAGAVSAAHYLFHSEQDEGPAIRDWLRSINEDMVVCSQAQSPDLGVRMYEAAHHAMACGAKKVVIIGTDVPDISADVISKVFKALDHHQIVFGPAVDGGYYLLGATHFLEGIFSEIAWSTDTVLEANVRNARQLNLSVAAVDTLPTLRDIDVIQDLKSWLADQKAHGSSPVHCLASIAQALTQ